MSRTLIVIAGILIASVFLYQKIAKPHPAAGKAVASQSNAAGKHVQDRVGILPPQDLPRFEQYMNWIARESDVDVRFVLRIQPVDATDWPNLSAGVS